MAPDEDERDSALVLDMVLAARDAIDFVADMDERAFLTSRLHQNAVIRSIEVIGEAAGKLSPGFRRDHSTLPWREITAMRHRLIHGYAEVRMDLVWAVVRDRVPVLLATLVPLIPEEAEYREE